METSHTLALRWAPVKRRRDPFDPFFEEGDYFCCSSAKQIPLEEDESERPKTSVHAQFTCCIGGCSESFDTILRYENHYNSMHRHTCTQCKRVCPSNHLLEVHLRESHDPLFQLQSGADKYLCLVQGCRGKFPDCVKRKDHMIKVHKYPCNYRFDRKTRSRKSKTAENAAGKSQPEEMEVQCHGDGDGKENVPKDVPAKRVFSYKVPPTICFGQGSAKGFSRPRGKRKPKHWHQAGAMETDTTLQIENVNMGDLADALVE